MADDPRTAVSRTAESRTAESRTARYEVVADALRERIRSGQLPPGSPLPGQRELSRSYGVSLMTLRRSLQCLEREGLVVFEPNRGTYVAPPAMSHQLTALHSISDELRSQGVEVRTTVLDVRPQRFPAEIARQFGSPVAGGGMRLERLRSVDQHPVIHQVSWVPAPWHEQLDGIDFGATSLYGSLVERCGLAIGRAEESIRAGLPAPGLAARLGLVAAEPILLLDRRTFDHRDQLILIDHAQILSRRLMLTTQRLPVTVNFDWSYRGSGPALR